MSYQPPPQQPPPPPPQGYGYQQGPAYGYQPLAAPAVYAHWGYRVGASLLDSIVVFVPGFVGYLIGGVLAAAGTNSDSGALAAVGFIFIILGYLASLAVGIWNLFVRQGTTGQSIGKQALGIRLVSIQTGQPMGGGMAFVRYVCHILDGLPCYVGYLWPLWDEKCQTFADKIVNSVVVRTA